MPLKAVIISSFATPGLQPGEVEAIGRQSRRNNARDAITGLLLFNGAMFVAAVEGPDAAVDALLARLACDQRHCEMQIRDERVLGARIFPGWTMGHVRLDGGWLEGQHDVADALAREMPTAMHELLLSLATTLPFG